MSSAIDTLKEMQEKLESLETRIKEISESHKTLEAQRDAIKSSLEFAKLITSDYEERAEEKLMADSEALAALWVSGRTNADFKTFSESCSLELPDAFPDEDDPGEPAERVA